MDKDVALHKFGRRLAALRCQKKLSVRELAIASGLTSRQIEQIEAGKVNLLFTTIVALARGLGVDPEELLETL